MGGECRDPNWKIPIRFFVFVFEAFPKIRNIHQKLITSFMLGKGKVSGPSVPLYLHIQWDQIIQMDRRRKNNHLGKMEPLNILSHETSLQFDH